MREEIKEQLRVAREKLREVELEFARLSARVLTLEEMLALTVEENVPTKKRRPLTRGRTLSEPWRYVLYYMTKEDDGAGVGYDDIERLTKKFGIETQKDNLRGQMASYKNSGYVTSPRPGRFSTTPEGRRLARRPLGDKDERPYDLDDILGDTAPQSPAASAASSSDYDDEIPF